MLWYLLGTLLLLWCSVINFYQPGRENDCVGCIFVAVILAYAARLAYDKGFYY